MSDNRLFDGSSMNGHDRRQTMLVPVAYSESVMPALRLARSSRIARAIAKWLFGGLVMTIILMVFAPWQQSVSGTGSVLAYSPDQRPQVIEATIKGRIVRWGDGIVENAQVTKGQVIAEIRDLDDLYAERLAEQLRNSESTVRAAEQELTAKLQALEFAKKVVEFNKAQVKTYQTIKQETIAAQNSYVDMAEKKVNAEKQQLAEYEAAIPQLEPEFERTERLQKAGNISLQKLQEVERKLKEAKTKVSRAKAYVEAAEKELEGKQRDRSAKIEKAQVDIEYAQAAVEKAEGEVRKAEADVAKAQSEIAKAEKAVQEMRVKVARQKSQIITAPFDGFVVQITPNMRTAILKEGDPICTIVPQTTDRSVQIWLDGNDAPLVEAGRQVRLQFEGWPAVQFSGWPSVAVGTFGGEVVSVDATDNGKGKFRILVQPDENENPWPDERFLRQGVRANGWVLLRQVPLWFEVWRQLNGFPPVVDLDGSSDKGSKNKPPKLPK